MLNDIQQRSFLFFRVTTTISHSPMYMCGNRFYLVMQLKWPCLVLSTWSPWWNLFHRTFHWFYTMPSIILVDGISFFPHIFVDWDVPFMTEHSNCNTLLIQIIVNSVGTNTLMSWRNNSISFCYLFAGQYFMSLFSNCYNTWVFCIFSPSVACICKDVYFTEFVIIIWYIFLE